MKHTVEAAKQNIERFDSDLFQRNIFWEKLIKQVKSQTSLYFVSCTLRLPIF